MTTLKAVQYIALDRRVIVAAQEGEVKDWAAYIGAVEGEDHDYEYEAVLRNGTKISEAMARLLFPAFAERFTWRD